MEQIRSFIAIELSEQILAAIAAIQRDFQKKVPAGVVRWVRPEGIHLTLQFLGDVPADRIKAVAEGVSIGCRGLSPFTVEVGNVGCFPNLTRPRVVWVGVSEPGGLLGRLQRQIQDNMEALGFAPEDRAFNPHLTLGRVGKDAAAGDVRRLGEMVASARVGAIGQMTVGKASLIRSDLKPGGAVYTRLAESTLSG